MAEHPLQELFAAAHEEEFNHSPVTNASMVKDLVRSGALRSPEGTTAFLVVDRRHFWMEGTASPELIYADMPLRTGRLHLSAPHIYAKALESLLPLKSGMSFLNVGSGTGYFNSIVAELTGGQATNHGIDIWPETVSHARERCRLRGTHHIEFTLGNVYELDVNHTMRYDRIYLGACANSRSKYLYRLLEVGGILIGPFQAGHSQQLRRVVRQTETQFNVEVLGSVQFACLVEPAPVPTPTPRVAALAETAAAIALSPTTAAVTIGRPHGENDGGPSSSSSPAVGLQGVPFTFELCEQPWTPQRCWIFPASYKRAVSMSLQCRPRNHTSPCLPTELWINHIFPWCPRWWFELPRPTTPINGPFSPPSRIPASPPSIMSAMPEDEAFLPLPPAATCLTKGPGDDGEEDLSDDCVSTAAPSSGASLAQTTPETGPSEPPTALEAEAYMSSAEDTNQEDEDVLFEVFSNGQRHAIGARGDPDDAELDAPSRLAVPLHVLRLLAEDNRRWYWMHRDEEDDHFGEEHDHEEEEDQEEEDDDEGYVSFEDDMQVEQATLEGEDEGGAQDVEMHDAREVQMEDLSQGDMP